MKKLRNDFGNLEKDISALMMFALFLTTLFYIYAIYYLWNRNLEEVLAIIMPFGALISAVLVAKVASRLLTHNKIARAEDDHKDIVRITHHLIAIVSDLRNRVEFAVNSFRDGGRPLIVLIENAVAIEKRYEVLLDREAYRFLSSESVVLIGRMSGQIFSLALVAKTFAEMFRDNSNVLIPASESPSTGKMIEGYESLLNDLDALEDQIRQLRETVE